MIVLFDLDDTLLKNPLDKFMRTYLGLLSKFLSPYVNPEIMVPQLLKSTDLMIAKDSPCKSLEMTFDEDFYPKLDLDKENIKELIKSFYENDFGALKQITSQIPDAIKTVEFAFANDCQVVIATNPLFPLRANLHRLDWAGLSSRDYPFTLITSYESMHFAKPNPAFYAEILGKLGWPEQPACVIGNSLKDDLVPALKLGIPGYYVTTSPEAELSEYGDNITSGNHAGIIPWLKQKIDTEKPQGIVESEGLAAVLKTTPAVLNCMTSPMTESQWRTKPGEKEWSIQEVICHLRDVDNEINIPRLVKFIDEEKPFITGVDSDPWVAERNYNSSYTPDALIEFCSARASLLEMVTRLSKKDWDKLGQHSIFGPTTLHEIIRFISVHDRDHIGQIKKTLEQVH